jgi:hypothetical protein
MLHKNPDAFQIEVILMSWNFCILKDTEQKSLNVFPWQVLAANFNIFELGVSLTM